MSAGVAVLSCRTGHYGNGPKVRQNCSKVKRKENSIAFYLSITLNICNFSVLSSHAKLSLGLSL